MKFEFVKKEWKDNRPSFLIAILRMLFGFIFLRSGLSKLLDPNFASGLTKTLTYFASQNPWSFYKYLLEAIWIPNSSALSVLVPLGEIVAGMSLILGLGVTGGAIIALILNINFYFAAGWTGPSTEALNILMTAGNVIFMLASAGRTLGMDKIITPYKKKYGI